MVRIAAVMAACPDANASAPIPPSSRVHDARIDVPEFAQSEKIRRVIGALEYVTGSRVDRNGSRRGGGVGLLSGVKR
jgi:hypothetical protein